MFGLPAACLAMYRTARPERRKAVGGMLFSMALTSFLTGVTEPIEFSFMFLAPVLYAVHAVLTGLAMVVMDLLDVRLGFGFSAGLFDYVLNFSQATRPLLLLPIGLAYFALYYGLFRFFIVRFDLKTPGREAEEAAAPLQAAATHDGPSEWVRALGGAANLVSVDACTTRLRLVVADQSGVDEDELKTLGARGVGAAVRRDTAGRRRSDRGSAGVGDSCRTRNPALAPAPAAWPVMSRTPHRRPSRRPSLLSALGGARNVREVRLAASRLCVTLHDAAAASLPSSKCLAVRAIARPSPQSVHVVVGAGATALFDELNELRLGKSA